MKSNFTMGLPRRVTGSGLPDFVKNRLLPLCCLLAVLSAAPAFAQQRTYDVNYDNRTIISVLDDLKTRTGYMFLHRDGEISDNETVSVRLSGATLDQILDRVLVEKGYLYSVAGNDVTIRRAPAIVQEQPPANPVTVTGRVVDSKGDPLIAASVLIRSKSRGVVTDAGGRFSIEVTPGDVLEFSYLGMKPTEIVFRDQQYLDIMLEDEANMIAEPVIVMGYGSARRLGSVVGSVASVNNDKLKNVPIANFSDALQGQVAGLSVLSSSGEPSATASIRLRGVNSMLAGNQPLYILDGAPVSQVVFSSLNQADIESFNILKDASATAIYGSRAANGVIVITTKKGKMGEDALITLRAQYGISQVAADKVSMMNSSQYFSFREMLTPSLATDADWMKHKKIILDNGISTDWGKYIYNDNAPTFNIDASVAGGSQKVSYYVSLNHNSVEGIAPTSEFQRTALRSSVEARVRDWFRLGLSTNIAYLRYNENPDVGGVGFLSPAAFARMARPDDSPYYYTVDENGKAIFGDRADYLHESAQLNPYFVESYRDRVRENLSLMVNMWEEIRPVNGLILRAAQSVDAFDYTYSSNIPPILDFVTPMNDHVIVNEGIGQARELFQRYYSFTFTNTAEYKLNLENRHFTTFLLGQEAIVSKERAFDVTFTGHNDKRLMLLSSGTDFLPPSHSIVDRVFNSAFFRVDYNYANKYFFDLTYRVDGSSKFGPNNRWAEFYSLGAKWNVASEPFMEKSRWVNDLNLRLSYGTTGNSNIGDYLFVGQVSGDNLSYEGEAGMINTSPGNPDLSWETVATLNAGIDFRLFDRFYGSVEFYRKKTTDMLMYIPYSSTTGYSGGYGNIGSMTNTGVDLNLSVDILSNRDISWTVRTTLNYNRNKITSLFNGLDEYVFPETGIKLQVGKPYGEFFVVRRQGVDPRDGKQIWLDKYGNQTKVYNEDDAVFVDKQRYAPFSGGFGTFFSYRNLSLNADFAFALGKYALNNDKYFFENAYAYGTTYNQSVNMLNMWTTPGQVTDIPAATEQVYADDHLLENASFLRLKSLQITYSLPEKWMEKSKFFRRASIFAVGRNLFTVTRYSGFDPEPDDNVIAFSYPNTRQYIFGVELTF